MTAAIDHTTFRSVLGRYPTGVCAIASLIGDRPVGMIVGSFTSISLDPMLVGFFPDHRSTTWPDVRSAGRFCVNVLSVEQHAICRALSSRQLDKFAGLDWHLSELGMPVFAGAVAWLECDLHSVHGAGDHDIAIGHVRSLTAGGDALPMIFWRGGYGCVALAPPDDGTSAVREQRQEKKA